MASEKVIVCNRKGLHARASSKFVNAVAHLTDGQEVTVAKKDNVVAGDSIMGLLMLGAAKGDEITISVEGENADAALAKLVGLVVDGFGED
ncbi:HPr family phosphocarrier protein [Parasphingorhabdus sp. DH2-15]|uniref:HPr family phosphocarrier protein n=1 Tax=Parasphingorhabdus sp. DH2-15 TaxID=3444112 RepID=UPI003F686D36